MLSVYLKRAGVISGSLFTNTSHSGLDVIKKYLCGQKQFSGGEHFLFFGNAIHEKWLKGLVKTYNKLTKPEKQKIDAMIKKLDAHPVVKQLFKNSVREDKFYKAVFGVMLAMILDIKQPPLKRGSDLKTTFCTTFIAFLGHAIKNGLFRQAVTYIKGAKLKEFYFIAISKEKPHNIFILDVGRYKNELRYAEQELKFLTYFFQNYGKIIPQQKPEEPSGNPGNPKESGKNNKGSGRDTKNPNPRTVQPSSRASKISKVIGKRSQAGKGKVH